MIFRRAVIGFSLCLAGVAVFAAPKYPPTQGWVTDRAGVLSAADRERLSSELQNFETKTSNEIAVAIIPSLEGDTVDDYAVGLFHQWGIGKKGKDNGVLILLAVQEHKIRIEVGYGVESILPDAVCGDIIRNMTPALRQNDFGGALRGAVLEIEQRLQGEAPAVAPVDEQPTRKRDLQAPLFALLLLFPVLPFTTVTVLLAFFLKALNGFFWWEWIPVPLGIILDTLRPWSRGSGSGGGRRSGWSGGGWGGGFGGGGFSGGGGGFGGFGGGSSGGGGASGSW